MLVCFPARVHPLSANDFHLRRIILMTCRSTSVITTASRTTITAEGNTLWDVRDLTKSIRTSCWDGIFLIVSGHIATCLQSAVQTEEIIASQH